MTAIYKRELRAYFHSFIGALFIGCTLCLLGIYFAVYNLFMGYTYIGYALSSVSFLFLISIPVLSMRILAEERKQKTDQLILTSPVSVSGIVVGKFLALATVYTIPVAIISIYPLILGAFGTVVYGESYLAVLGFYLYGLSCIAICMFVSSLTESQVIAAVISFIFLFLGYAMAGICNMISSTGNIITKILDVFNMVSRFDDLLNGSLHLSSIFYYISVILLALMLTVQSIQKRRYQVSVKALSMGVYSSSVVIISTAVIVLLNVLLAQLPSGYTVFDVTTQKLYSLTQESKDMTTALTEDVTVYVLVNEKQADEALDITLRNYEALNSHVKVSYIDPAVNPKFYTTYTDQSLTSNSLIFESEKRSRVVDYNSIYQTEFDYNTYSSTITGYDGEGQITSAIAYVTTDDMPKMYFLEGHGELAFETAFLSSVEKENVAYETINLMNYDAVPEDANCIVINAPTEDFSSDDTDKIEAFINKGGNLLIVSTYTGKDMPNFAKILKLYGATVSQGLIIESNQQNYYQDPFYLLPNIASDTVTTGIYGSGSYVFVPYAQGLTYAEQEDVTVTELLTSSESSYVREDVQNSTEYAKQERDLDGPFAIGLKCEKTLSEGSSTAIIYSSEYIFMQDTDSMVSGTNAKLFIGTLGNLIEHTSTVAIPVKSYSVEYLTLSQSKIAFLALVTVILIPFTFLIGGFVIWFRRRKR